MEVKRYVALIWRWAWLIVLGIIVAGGSAFLVSKNTTPVYQASARFLIDEAPGATGNNEYAQILLEERLTQTYVQIMETNSVLNETIDRLNLPFTAKKLAGMVSVTAPPETQILIVNVEDIDPNRAAAIANTLGEVFISQNQQRENKRYAEPIRNWENRIAEIGDEIEQLEQQIGALSAVEELSPEDQATLSRLETQQNEAQVRYTDAFNRLNDLQIAQVQESNNIQPIEPAVPPDAPIRPRTFTNTLLAAIVGGMLALGIVFFIEYLDDTVKTPDQVLADTELPTLGAIAFIKGDEPAERLIADQRPRDPISEAYRVLRTNLGFSAIDEGLQDLLITSASPGEGKSTTAANLATVMAQTNKRVIIIDADLRRPTQHKIFTLPNNQGLTTALLDQKTPIIEHIQSTKVPGLRVMASGPIPPNPSELLNSQRMSQVIRELHQESDVLIFDTPPALTVADASILAPRLGGCVLVVEVGKTRRDTLAQATQRLQQTGSNLYGVVMNRLRPNRSGYYYDYYYYYYHYYGTYEQDNKKRKTGQGSGKRLSWPSLSTFRR